MQAITLQSSEGTLFTVDLRAATCCRTIKTMLDDLGMNEEEQEIIPLPNVTTDILSKVLVWAEHHKNDPKIVHDDENNGKTTDDISEWDVAFLDVDQGTLFELILAANYLDIEGLLNVACKTVAKMIKGKTPPEIRHAFNIENDFTPEEEEQIKEENEWCMTGEDSQMF